MIDVAEKDPIFIIKPIIARSMPSWSVILLTKSRSQILSNYTENNCFLFSDFVTVQCSLTRNLAIETGILKMIKMIAQWVHIFSFSRGLFPNELKEAHQ